MQAIILGATGATGKDLLQLLLQDKSISEVKIFVRKQTNITHPKLTEYVIDFEKTDLWQHLVKGDILFSCLGTTLKVAGSKQAQWKIDFDYQYAFANAAKQNNVNTYVLVSALGASSKSKLFYPKMKGKLEEEVKKLNFKSSNIFQPPLLIRENTDRRGEKVAEKIILFFNALGLFKSQTPLKTKDLALAIITVAEQAKSGVNNYVGKNIKQIL